MNSLERAIVRLLREKPFYGHFILNLRRSELTSRYAAGVTVRDGIPTIGFNAECFEHHSPEEQQALLEHLVKHVLHLHPLRRNGRVRHDWDVACDLAINPTVQGLAGYAAMPEMLGLEPGLAAEEYYSMLSHPFDVGNLDGNGYGDCEQEAKGSAGEGERNVRNCATVDDHEIWSHAESTPPALAEEMVRSITRDSLRGSDGKAPEDIRVLVDGLLEPPHIPWRQILRQFIAVAGRSGRSTTWMREHRRFAHSTPGIRTRRRLNLVVAIDVSDSTDSVELRETFAQELLQISRGRDAKITVLYANSRIQRIECLTGAGSVVQRYDGGGFTDLRPVFEFAGTLHPLPAAVIYLTDGIGPAPESMIFPTLWVLTRKGEKPVPWGVELRLAI